MMTASFIGALLILAGGSSRGHHAGLGEMTALTLTFIVGAVLVYAWVGAPLVIIGWMIGPAGNANWFWLSLVWYGATLVLIQHIGERRIRST